MGHSLSCFDSPDVMNVTIKPNASKEIYWTMVSIDTFASVRVCRLLSEFTPRQKQYQSTMDALRSMAHYFVMELLRGRSGKERPLLSVVDDDESMRESLPDLINEFGFAARAFSSAEEFLSSGSVDETSCLILDIAMPGMSGPELYQELKRRGEEIPTIFITAQKDETIRARVLEQGAAGFLLKPFSDASLLAAIKSALQAI
jgi:CheY-like chemotaxis protein